MKDLDYVLQIERAAEERAEAWRLSQRRQRRLFFMLLAVLMGCSLIGGWVMVRIWQDATVQPEEPRPALKAPLEPGQPVREGNSIRFTW